MKSAEQDVSNSDRLRALAVHDHYKEHGTFLSEVAYELEVKSNRIRELETLINNPELDDFITGFRQESAHQIERWGRTKEEKNYPQYYATVVSYLLGKFISAIWDRNTEKFKHHCISIAAVLFNCHRQVYKTGTQVSRWFSGEGKSGENQP
jgi:hypothetical protein